MRDELPKVPVSGEPVLPVDFYASSVRPRVILDRRRRVRAQLLVAVVALGMTGFAVAGNVRTRPVDAAVSTTQVADQVQAAGSVTCTNAPGLVPASVSIPVDARASDAQLIAVCQELWRKGELGGNFRPASMPSPGGAVPLSGKVPAPLLVCRSAGAPVVAPGPCPEGP